MALAAPASAKPAAVAMATHQSYIGYWVVSGEKTEGAAGKAALKMCNKATSGGCEIAVTSTAAEFVVGYGINGDLMYATGTSPQTARQALDERCKTNTQQDCAIESSFTVSIRSKLESNPPERRKFAAVAGDFALGGDSRIWVVTGQASWNEAIDKAMSGCVAALGRPTCKYVTTSGLTHIALYRNATGSEGGMRINLSAQAAMLDIQTICKAASYACAIIALRTAKDEAVEEYNLQTAPGSPLEDYIKGIPPHVVENEVRQSI